jgi:enoyl-CoA hydratase/carnithine racemase
MNTIEGGSKPTVAAVNGTAFGGGLELAMSCNARVGNQKSLWGLPELKY